MIYKTNNYPNTYVIVMAIWSEMCLIIIKIIQMYLCVCLWSLLQSVFLRFTQFDCKIKLLFSVFR